MGMSVVARGAESSEYLIEMNGNLKENRSGPLRLSSPYLCVLLEPLESLFAAELRFHPIERTLLCQAGADRCCGFATTFGERGNLAVDILVGGVDVFRRGDAIEQQLGFDVFDGAVVLPAAHGYPVHVDRARIDALRGQGADGALQAHIHLIFNQRFGHGEIVSGDDFCEQRVADGGGLALVALGFKALPDFRRAVPRAWRRRSRPWRIRR